MYLTATPMPSVTITPPGRNSSKFPGIAPAPLDSPGELFRRILDGEPSVEDVLAMIQYKMFLKLKGPEEFMRLGDPVLIGLTWDALMSKDWKLEVFP